MRRFALRGRIPAPVAVLLLHALVTPAFGGCARAQAEGSACNAVR